MSLRLDHSNRLLRSKRRACVLIIGGILLISGATLLMRFHIVSKIKMVSQKSNQLVLNQEDFNKIKHYKKVNDLKENSRYILKAINDLNELKNLKMGFSKIVFESREFYIYSESGRSVKKDLPNTLRCWKKEESSLITFKYLC